MKTCICDNCEYEIAIEVREEMIDRDEHGEKIYEQFFLCPNCLTRYSVFISDAFMRRKIWERKRIRRNPFTFSVMVDERLKKEMQDHQEELKQKYYGRTGGSSDTTDTLDTV